jgi:hypothetical protein
MQGSFFEVRFARHLLFQLVESWNVHSVESALTFINDTKGKCKPPLWSKSYTSLRDHHSDSFVSVFTEILASNLQCHSSSL